MRNAILVAVEGLFEKSDSIGYDAVYQFEQLLKISGSNVRIFASNYKQENYPGIPIEPAEVLFDGIRDAENSTLIYHFCDGWRGLEECLADFPGRLIVRWHNNTPPWFFGNIARNLVQRTTLGFKTIVDLAQRNGVEFWCNSEFTVEQLKWLTSVGDKSAKVVYPASRFLAHQGHSPGPATVGVRSSSGPISLVFVSRVTAHKGHVHVPIVAAYVQRLLKRPVVVTFVGRSDGSAASYISEIRSVSAALDIQVDLVGEVSQGELESHYKAASVFICLSQHEGFGMPVFEAMRMNVPVVAWRNTAVAELLHDHPTAFSEFDHRKFAAAVAAYVEYPMISADVVEWQRTDILPRYTSQVVNAQIKAALAKLHLSAGHQQPENHNRFQPLLRAIEQHSSALYSIKLPKLGSAAREIPSNFVSNFDIASYTALLDDALMILPARGSAPEESEGSVQRRSGGNGLKLPPSRFTIPGGTAGDAGVQVPFAGNGTHLIFGPYIRGEAGRYRVEYLLSLSAEALSAQKGRLILDVVSGGERKAVLTLNSFDVTVANRIVLEFVHAGGDSTIEFRVEAADFGSGYVTFGGVSIWRVDLEGDILSDIPRFRSLYSRDRERVSSRMGQRPSNNGRNSHRLKLTEFWTRRRTERSIREPLAQGDAARDRRDWKTASEAYAEVVRLDPENFRIWIQYGHALKEMGQWAKAEETYRRALSLAPTDADCLLQLGHILKLLGRFSEASAAYFAAFECDPTCVDAKREFMDMVGL